MPSIYFLYIMHNISIKWFSGGVWRLHIPKARSLHVKDDSGMDEVKETFWEWSWANVEWNGGILSECWESRFDNVDLLFSWLSV